MAAFITCVRSGRRDVPKNMTTQYLCSKIEGLIYLAGLQEQRTYDFICEQARIPLISMFFEVLGWMRENSMDALNEV